MIVQMNQKIDIYVGANEIQLAILGTEPGPVFLIYPSKHPPLILIRVDP